MRISRFGHALGLDCLTPIIWHKIANRLQEAAGNGAGYYGKPYQPGGVVKPSSTFYFFARGLVIAHHSPNKPYQC